jgi:DNA modification methylase
MTTPYFRTNTIYCGDCKDVLKQFPEKSVDLIYADPPFFSNQQYEVIWGDGYEIRAFEDRWKGGINNYQDWMTEKLKECERVLKDTGSMYLHCDWHASHYLKTSMDDIFGYNNFRNEIIWKRSHSRSSISKVYRRAHDTILFYTKTNKYTFNKQYGKLSPASMKLYVQDDKDGKGKYRLVPVLVSGVRHGETGQIWHGIDPNKLGQSGMHWVTKPSNLEKYDKEGLLVWSKKTGGSPQLKYYLETNKGVPLSDVWTSLGIIEAGAGELLGYPTQKPEKLLKRIIDTSSNVTDIVLDPFCGCGTAIVVAHKLGRRWVGIDVSPTACKLMQKRFRKLHVSVPLMGMPYTEADLRKLDPFEFQNWVVQRLFGRVSSRKSSDMGIDGTTFEGYPIQVKQSDDIGRNPIDNFETAMRRRKATKGVFVAFSFGSGAYEEIARAKLHDNLEIIHMTIKDLIGKEQTIGKQEGQAKL